MSPTARLAVIVLPALVMASGCGSAHPLHCQDLAAPAEASFAKVSELVGGTSERSCARCHNTASPVRNLNFEGPGVAYDALTSRATVIYEQVASGNMPQGGPAWTEADLRVLRTWYCIGAPYGG